MVSSSIPPPGAQSRPTHERGIRLASGLAHMLGWLLLIGWAYCYEAAAPQEHKIDRFFGVARQRSWDEQLVAFAVALSGGALILSILSVLLGASLPKREEGRPLGVWFLVGLSVVAVALAASRL